MATKKKTSVPPDKLELYENLVEAAGIDSKSNFGSAYTAVNGNMYSMISKHWVVGIRLPDEEGEGFIDEYDTEMFRADPSWPPSRNMVTVPDDLLQDTKALAPYLKRSFEYTSTLKPKPTKKK